MKWPSGLARPRALLFDWDNTLVDNWATITEALNATFAEFGMRPWTLAEAKQRVRGSMRETFPAMFGQDWRRAGQVFYDTFQAKHLQTINAMPGADALIKRLRAWDFYLGVVSNKNGPFLRAEAEHLGWREYFGGIVGAGDCASDKPASDPVDLALKSGNIARGADVWLVGDADIDMECAHNSGCTAVLLHPDPPSGGSLARHPPALKLKDCRELLALLAEP